MTEALNRFPAYPLIAHDPYFSVWSFNDELNGGCPRHWTGSNMGTLGLIRIDGCTYRWMGEARGVDSIPQTYRSVTPTKTTYVFEGNGVKLTVGFLTPALLDNLDILSRPVTYLSYAVESTDGARHLVDVYVDFAGEYCVNQGIDPVTTARYSNGDMELLSMTALHPQMLERVGDNLRIEWGRFYLCFVREESMTGCMGLLKDIRETFMRSGLLPECDDLTDASIVRHPCMGVAADKKFVVEAEGKQEGHVLVAYDDIYSVEFLRQRLVAYWRRNGLSFGAMLTAAESEYADLARQCRAFDEKMMSDTRNAGGEDYAALCAICYRQSIAAHKLVAAVDGTPYFFSKENFSNGCICTVDVTYPSAPLYLWLQPALLKGMLLPIMEYSSTGRWRFPFAPHDLGTYPLANGQVYGGGERTEVNQMPVEECGNMLILAAALLRFHNDVDFVKKYWDILVKWADYLLEKGYDPENQLCTDDFAGHLAHNTNLSLKAIMALGGCSQMAAVVGENALADKYMAAARTAAERWQIDALDAAGCYRLAFDREGSWSQKYNLVWDKLLGLNLFPETVAARELEHYIKIQDQYGLALDNRQPYTKLDWILWSATLTGKQDDFNALLKPVMTFLAETPDRVPVTDWYWTKDAKKRGFQARSVVGGVFLKMLYDMPVKG